MSQSIELRVRHNMEVAHRLLTLPGKCQNIHGHGMQVELSVLGQVDDNGYALFSDGTPIEFSRLKQEFRAFIDAEFDHRLHLNEEDPWAANLGIRHNAQGRVVEQDKLPGLQTWPGDPSTENFAIWILEACRRMFGSVVLCISIQETGTNGVKVYT